MTRLDLTSHSSLVQLPRLPSVERTPELLMHLTRLGAMKTEEVLRQHRLDAEAEKYAEGRRFKHKGGF